MALDFSQIRDDMAQAIADAIAAASTAKMAELPVTSIALTATYTWSGTDTVTSSDTSEVVAGDHVKLDSDGKWYFVQSINPNVSIKVQDKYSVGSFPSGSSGTSRSASALPNPPTGSSLLETIGEPIAFPVVDDGIQVVSEAPHELPNYTVSQVLSIPSPAAGALVFVTDEIGGPIPAFWDGSKWRRVTDRAVIA